MRDQFADLLNSFRSSSEYQSLIDVLLILDATLSLDLAPRIEAAQTAWDEFEEGQAAYEDRAMDEWKDRRGEQRFADESVHDLFDSLRLT